VYRTQYCVVNPIFTAPLDMEAAKYVMPKQRVERVADLYTCVEINSAVFIENKKPHKI
jgi:hypothetical protein